MEKGFVIETEDQLEESLSHAIGIYSNECFTGCTSGESR
jgi:hypothetical protein